MTSVKSKLSPCYKQSATSITTATTLTFLIAAENNPGAASLLGTVVTEVDGSPVDAVLAEPASPPVGLPELAAEVSCEPDTAVSLDVVSPAATEPVPVALLPVSLPALFSALALPVPVSEAEDSGVGSDKVVPPKVTGAPPGVKVVEPKTNSDLEFSLNVAEPTTMTDEGG